MAFNLSAKQLAVLQCLRRFARDNGYMPSIRELARERSIAVATARQYLDALKLRGWLQSDGTPHGLSFRTGLVDELDALDAAQGSAVAAPGRKSTPSRKPPGGPAAPDVGTQVPVVGCIAAGHPLEAIEVEGGSVVVPQAMARPGAFALRVRGSSMVDDHILDGDLVIVAPQPRVDNGEVAVVLLEDGTATLKRVYREKGRVRLQPANATMKPIYVTRLRIQGRVTGVLRMVR